LTIEATEAGAERDAGEDIGLEADEPRAQPGQQRDEEDPGEDGEVGRCADRAGVRGEVVLDFARRVARLGRVRHDDERDDEEEDEREARSTRPLLSRLLRRTAQPGSRPSMT
jgi:hypothetical protein